MKTPHPAGIEAQRKSDISYGIKGIARLWACSGLFIQRFTGSRLHTRSTALPLVGSGNLPKLYFGPADLILFTGSSTLSSCWTTHCCGWLRFSQESIYETTKPNRRREAGAPDEWSRVAIELVSHVTTIIIFSCYLVWKTTKRLLQESRSYRQSFSQTRWRKQRIYKENYSSISLQFFNDTFFFE